MVDISKYPSGYNTAGLLDKCRNVMCEIGVRVEAMEHDIAPKLLAEGDRFCITYDTWNETIKFQWSWESRGLHSEKEFTYQPTSQTQESFIAIVSQYLFDLATMLANL